MSKVETASAINQIHGKTNGRDKGYFYMRNGRQFYRTRDESYQKKQSPRQKWNSAAFSYANSQIKLITSPEAKTQLEADFEAANHIASNGKKYTTVRSWKFNSLLYDYKQSHPFNPQS